MISLTIKIFSRIGIVFALIAGTFAAATPLIVSATPTPVTVLNAGSRQQFLATTATGAVQVVYWTVSGSGCSGFGCGSITINGGLYSAPATLSSPILVTITAISVRNFSNTGSLTITVNPGAGAGGGTTVSISPPTSLKLNAGASETFSANVLGNANTAVTWTAGGTGCGGTCGSITSGGFYTAPASLTRTLSVVITATSQATPSASASVTIQLIPVVAISITPFNSQMAPGTSQQFFATVTGSSIQSVTWSVSGGGTISSSGFYTAPGTVTSPLSVNVRATANADTSKFATAALVVGPIVTISVSPSGISLSVNAQQQYSVSVVGASSTTVSWSVSGSGCSGVTCGTISTITPTTALYLAPSTVPSPATVTITATLATDSTKSGSSTVTIVPSSNTRLTGQYAFLFRGFDAAGPYQAAGTITSDGNGNITTGIEDINCGLGAQDSICASGPVSGASLTGTYTINADGRGTFTITAAGGQARNFSLAMNAANTKARFIESDSATSGIRGSGVLELQTPSAFTNASLSTAYAFNLSGVDSSGLPIAAIGNMSLFVKNLIPTISSGAMDVNDNGNLSCYPEETAGSTSCISAVPAFQWFSGTYNIGPNGRGTAQFSIPGFDGNSADVSVFNFSLYVISPGEFFLLSMDDPGLTNNPVFSGQALGRLVAPSIAFQPGLAVFSWSGSSVVPPGSAPGTLGTPEAAIGQVSINDSTGDLTGLQYDLNNGGVVTWATGQGICSTTNKKGQILPNGACTYSVQPNGDILVSGGSAPNLIQFHVFPISTNAGFLLGPSVTVGKIESQSTGFPFPFMFGSDLMVSPTAPLISGTGSFGQSVTRTAPVTGNEDKSDESLPGGFMSDLPFTGYYANPTLPNGHAFMYFGTPGVPSLDFWVVSSTEMVAIDVDNGVVPNLIIFEQ